MRALLVSKHTPIPRCSRSSSPPVVSLRELGRCAATKSGAMLCTTLYLRPGAVRLRPPPSTPPSLSASRRCSARSTLPSSASRVSASGRLIPPASSSSKVVRHPRRLVLQDTGRLFCSFPSLHAAARRQVRLRHPRPRRQDLRLWPPPLPCSASCPGASSTCAAGRVLREFSALISSSWSFLA
jgi:hypothetical protein